MQKEQALVEHKLTLMGVLERHMSEEVKQRVRATENGLIAYKNPSDLGGGLQ